MAKRKPNRYKTKGNKLQKDDRGVTASDHIQNSLETAFAPVEDAIVGSLHMQDKALTEARVRKIGENIDRKRINAFNNYLNETLNTLAEGAIEAGRQVETQRLTLEAETIEAEVVEVKSFADVFASKLGGAMVPSDQTETKSLPEPSDELDELKDIMS